MELGGAFWHSVQHWSKFVGTVSSLDYVRLELHHDSCGLPSFYIGNWAYRNLQFTAWNRERVHNPINSRSCRCDIESHIRYRIGFCAVAADNLRNILQVSKIDSHGELADTNDCPLARHVVDTGRVDFDRSYSDDYAGCITVTVTT